MDGPTGQCHARTGGLATALTDSSIITKAGNPLPLQFGSVIPLEVVPCDVSHQMLDPNPEDPPKARDALTAPPGNPLAGALKGHRNPLGPGNVLWKFPEPGQFLHPHHPDEPGLGDPPFGH